jgi:hypothetical protein
MSNAIPLDLAEPNGASAMAAALPLHRVEQQRDMDELTGEPAGQGWTKIECASPLFRQSAYERSMVSNGAAAIAIVTHYTFISHCICENCFSGVDPKLLNKLLGKKVLSMAVYKTKTYFFLVRKCS